MRMFCVLSLVALLSLSSVQAEEEADYFPLEVGNTWTYERNILTWVGEQWVYVPDYISVKITHVGVPVVKG